MWWNQCPLVAPDCVRLDDGGMSGLYNSAHGEQLSYRGYLHNGTRIGQINLILSSYFDFKHGECRLWLLIADYIVPEVCLYRYRQCFKDHLDRRLWLIGAIR